MSYKGKGSASKTPASPSNGVGFFEHFPKNLIRPYGGTEEPITDEMVNKRVKFYNCEMLKRPRVAMSELAQTTTETIKCLSEIKKPIVDPEELKQIRETIKPFDDLLQPLKLREGRSEATEANVKAAVRSFLQPNPKLDKYMNRIYLTASNLLTLSTQYIVTKSLLTNPDMFAEKVHATEVSDAAFKKTKDVKAMKNFLINACLSKTKKAKPSVTKNLLQAFDSSDEEEEVETEESSDSEASESSSKCSITPLSEVKETEGDTTQSPKCGDPQPVPVSQKSTKSKKRPHDPVESPQQLPAPKKKNKIKKIECAAPSGQDQAGPSAPKKQKKNKK